MTPSRYMDLAASLGCLPCLMDGIDGTPAQLHHPRAEAGLSERGDDMAVTPLCVRHHLTGGVYPWGQPFPGIHQDTTAFRARYGEDWLLSEITSRRVHELENSIIGKQA